MRRIKLFLGALVVMVATFAAFAGPAMAQDYYPYDGSYGYNTSPYDYNSTDLNSALSNYVDYSIYNDLYGYSPYSNYGYSPYDNYGYGYSPYNNYGY